MRHRATTTEVVDHDEEARRVADRSQYDRCVRRCATCGSFWQGVRAHFDLSKCATTSGRCGVSVGKIRDEGSVSAFAVSCNVIELVVELTGLRDCERDAAVDTFTFRLWVLIQRVMDDTAVAHSSLADDVQVLRDSSPSTWSSGRQLTEAQRERKREVNRTTRRLQRSKKNADRIALLESQLERLKPRTDAEHDENNRRALSSSSYVRASAAEAASADMSLPAQSSASSVVAEGSPLGTVRAGVSLPERPFLMRDPAARDMTDMLNAGIGSALYADSTLISTDVTFNESVIAHAILYGWAKTELRHNLSCPILSALRFLDENLFLHSGPMERLTMMHCISRQLLVRDM